MTGDTRPHFVCVEFVTDEHGKPVPDDMPAQELPRCYFGPFATAEEAVRWMEDDYPDGDTDVHDMHAFQADSPESLGYVNTPGSIRGEE